MPDVIESVGGRENTVSADEADAMIELFASWDGVIVRPHWERVQYIIAVYREGQAFAFASYLIRF